MNCLFYNDDYESTAPGYRDIFLERSFGGIVTGNVFHQPGNRNRTMIALGEGARDLQVRNNLFNARGLAIARGGDDDPVEMAEQAESLAQESILVSGNQFSGHYRSPQSNDEYRPGGARR